MAVIDKFGAPSCLLTCCLFRVYYCSVQRQVAIVESEKGLVGKKGSSIHVNTGLMVHALFSSDIMCL